MAVQQDVNTSSKQQQQQQGSRTHSIELTASQEKDGFDHLEDLGRQAEPEQAEEVDPEEARRIIRKVDYRLIPMLMLMYTLTFLDRVNIGNARLWNLEEDLGMTGYDYNIVILGTIQRNQPTLPLSRPELAPLDVHV